MQPKLRRSPDPGVATGLDRCLADPGLVGSGSIGLITNSTCVTADLRAGIQALIAVALPVRALFGPEHGLRGTAPAGASEVDEHDPSSGLPLYDTYGKRGAALEQLVRDSGVDVLVYDLQDTGARFYTYVWTMFDLMLAASRTGRRFVVLDRPNPIGGTLSAGPMLEAAYASFVGRAGIPVRYGLTCGELARHLNATTVPALAGAPVDLSVVAMQGWRRALWFDQTGLPWVPPSPNIPTLDTATVYPGTCLFEGMNMSEGRGTTRPFELIGAPYVDERYARALNERELAGVVFRDTWFTPGVHKYAGQTIRGVQVHVLDRDRFEPVRAAVVMLGVARDLYPDFGVRELGGAGVVNPGTGFGIDRLWGSDQLRRALRHGNDPAQLVPSPSTPASWVATGSLLYA